MRRVCVVLFAGLLVCTLTAPAGRQGFSCALPPPGSGPAAPVPLVGPGGVRPPADPGVRRNPPEPYALGTPPPTVEPMEYRHAVSGLALRFEADGQHVSAMEPSGKQRWRVNVIDSAIRKGREFDGKKVWATVIYAGPPSEWMVSVAARNGKRGEFVAVGMNTKEGGLLDVRTGEYLTMGGD